MKPLLKWAGGKTKMLPALTWQLPVMIDLYVEPFIGGGALFFQLAKEKRFKKAIIADTNADLIELYSEVKWTPRILIRDLKKFRYEEKFYYDVRNNWPSSPARTLFLNRTCFNGLWRVNQQGKFNVPFGKYTNPTICDEMGIMAASEALQNTEILHVDFERLFVRLNDHALKTSLSRSNVVCYCDPPYDVISDTADFTSYAKGGFGWPDQERLASWPYWTMTTNADTKRIRRLYKGHSIEAVKMKRNINSVAAKRGAVNELIIRRRA